MEETWRSTARCSSVANGDPAQGETGDTSTRNRKTIAKVAVAAEQDVRGVTAAQRLDDVWFDTPPKNAVHAPQLPTHRRRRGRACPLESIDVGSDHGLKADIPSCPTVSASLQELPAAKKASQPVSTRGGSPP